jgi:hypothetical protein
VRGIQHGHNGDHEIVEATVTSTLSVMALMRPTILFGCFVVAAAGFAVLSTTPGDPPAVAEQAAAASSSARPKLLRRPQGHERPRLRRAVPVSVLSFEPSVGAPPPA